MQTYTKEVKVLYSDTDAYGVVWHGGYVKWFEEGRCGLCDIIGLSLPEIEKNGICFPLVDMHIRYKSPAKLFDELLIETFVKELKKTTIEFSHTVKNKNSGKILVIAETIIVAVSHTELKMFRVMPDYLYNAFEKAL